jgi:2',3'-cyclic-nucleotide 2'-phosphodiesterase (5'-nucleotidase family)
VEPYKVPWIADGKRDIGGWANITTLVKKEKAKTKLHGFLMQVTILPALISAV